MSWKIEMRSVFYLKKTLRFTVSNKIFLFNHGIKQSIEITSINTKINEYQNAFDLSDSITELNISESYECKMINCLYLILTCNFWNNNATNAETFFDEKIVHTCEG